MKNITAMLNRLTISNLALIEYASIEFDPHFNVITGESGAGKSICIGALGLLLGARGDKGVIRTGCDRCEISAEFTVPENLFAELRELLKTLDVELPDAFLAARKVITASSSRNYLNSTPVSGHVLSEVLAHLIDLQNPLDQLSLGSRNRQLALLDRYAGSESELAECARCAALLDDKRRELADFLKSVPSEAEAELAQEVVSAVDEVAPEAGEDELLEQRHALAAHSRGLLENCSTLVNLLTESDDSLADRMAEINRHLAELGRIDTGRGAELEVRGDELSERIRELSNDLERYAAAIDLDEAAFAELEERLSKIYTLKRRYGPSLEQVMERRDQARATVNTLAEAAGKKADFAAEEMRLTAELAAAAHRLSTLRKKKSGEFARAVLEKLAFLGFRQCRLLPEFTEKVPSANGMDELDWLFSANTGETPRPLRQIASSGERSRLFLAMKEVLAQSDEIPVVVFDEIDVNIGGVTANRVAEALRELGRSRQILCISHLAQVASRADCHFVVVKSEAEGRTVSLVRRLADSERAAELSRMLGAGRGADVHAADLLKR